MHLIFNRFAITEMSFKTYFQIKNSLVIIFHNIADFTLFLSNKAVWVSITHFFWNLLMVVYVTLIV